MGAATVRRLCAAGWEVLAVARRADRLEALATETGCATRVVDVTRPDDVEALRAALAHDVATSGAPVDTVVLNAGLAIGVDSVEDADAEDWTRMFDVNVLGAQRVVAALLPLLREGARSRGVADVLAVTSTAGQRAYEGGGGYAASKFALRALMDTLRLELAGEPIRVVQVSPGMVRTEEFTLNRLRGDADRAAALYEGVENPLTADDVALVIAQTLALPGHINVDEVTVRPLAQAAQHKLIRGPLRPREEPSA
jgi:NADP-dependent 3-hydroxy acid dehydrogenase YdfG